MNPQDHGKKRSLYGQYFQQSWSSLFLIEKVLEQFKPTGIIELGTAAGMLSRYFGMYVALTDGAWFRTTDLKSNPNLEVWMIKMGPFLQCENKDIYAPETVIEYCDALNTTKTPLIFIDGKDPKSNEINLYVPKLKKGTVVLAHDFIDTKDTFSWGFRESDVKCWDKLDKLQPYWDKSREYNARLFCTIVK